MTAQTPTTSSVAEGRMFKLNKGSSIPAVGFGTWKSSPEDAYSSVKTALEIGAWIYGNESDVGRALKDSSVPRDDIFLTTKLQLEYISLPGRRKSRVVSEAARRRLFGSVSDALVRAQVLHADGRVEALNYHRPVALNPNGQPPNFPLRPDGSRDLHEHDFVDTWRDMEKLLSSGKVKAIGVSNFDIHNLEILLQNSTVRPAVNQVELHAYLQQKKLHKYCNNKGIHLTAYSPLGSTGSFLKSKRVVTDIASQRDCDPCAVLLA